MHLDNLDLETTLHIGVLGHQVDEEHLRKHFSQVGPVKEVRLRKCKSNSAEKYGFIIFYCKEHAREALFQLNYSSILGRQCRLSPYSPNKDTRIKANGNLVLSNIEQKLSEKEIHTTLSKIGNLLAVRASYKESKAYLHFENDEAAFRAAQTVTNSHVFGAQTHAMYTGVKSLSSEIVLKNLDKNLTIKVLVGLLSKYGELQSCNIHTDLDGTSLGSASATFETRREASLAVSRLNGLMLGNKVVRVVFRNDNINSLSCDGWRENTLHVKNLDTFVNIAHLKDVFSPFGIITECKIMYTPAGISRGFGFVTFKNREDADRARINMEGYILGKKKIYPSFYQNTKHKNTSNDIKSKPQVKYTNIKRTMNTTYESDPTICNDVLESEVNDSQQAPPSPINFTPLVSESSSFSSLPQEVNVTENYSNHNDEHMIYYLKDIAYSLANILDKLSSV